MECWPWTGPVGGQGHGTTTYEKEHHPAHRVAYMLTRGPVAPGLVVRHMCDNPPCCNPAHLVLGTPADNVRDMHERGRARTSSLLSADDVRTIRNTRPINPTTKHELARRFGVSYGTISGVMNGSSWKRGR